MKQALLIKYDFKEWNIVLPSRRELRLYQLLAPDQRRSAGAEAGFALKGLSAPQMGEALRALEVDPGAFSPEELATGRFHIRLRPRGVYEWSIESRGRPLGDDFFPVQPVEVRENTREKAASAVTARLKSQGWTDAQVGQETHQIGGPNAGILCRLQIGGNYYARETQGMLMRRKLGDNGSGIFAP